MNSAAYLFDLRGAVTLESPMHNFWPSCGFAQLQRNERAWLVPTDDYLRLFLARPELALVEESCPTEHALHGALQANPRCGVTPHTLESLQDADVRSNYVLFLRLRDGLLAAGTLEAYYLGLLRSGRIDIPPLFVDLLVQAIVRGMLDAATDPLQLRAAELLFRSQRVSLTQGRVLAADREAVDLQSDTGGLGDMGRFLREANAPLGVAQMEVLTDDNAPRYWLTASTPGTPSLFVLDLTHEVTQELSHGLTFTMVRSRSGLKALAQVLALWVGHFLGVDVQIQPVPKIDDPAWRWHVGLDVESTGLLNALYEGQPVAPERLQQLISLFRLDFANPQEMRADVAGKPVYLGLAMDGEQVLRLKPQNLLLNLPLAAAM